MSSTVKRVFGLIGFLGLFMLLAVSTGFAQETPTATYGTPQLGANDPLWEQTMAHSIDQSTVPDDPRPHATGTARILWDEDYVYVRVEVEDEDVYIGDGNDHTYDSVEFYLGSGSNGSNQWRISSTGIWSGQNAQGRAGWTVLTDDGYIVEVRLPKRDVELVEGPLTFEVYINNSSSDGNDRYEVVSAFGEPDTGFSGSGAFTDSVMLVQADEVDARYSITATAGSGGSISPRAPGNVFRVVEGEDITFTFTPDSGQVIDTVTVDGEEVTVSEDNTYTIEDVSSDHEIHVTFQYNPDAELFDFIVWNDNFADGEYTTAVIIDLGEGNAVNASDLSSDMFTVTARDTSLDGSSEELTGVRNIQRVYVNDVPEVRGYQGPVTNSPDYQEGLDSGRYIVVEIAFFTASGGVRTIVESNSTLQIYEVVQNEALNLVDGRSLDNVVYAQVDVVNPVLDKFETYADNGVNRSVYMHRNGSGEVVNGLLLYVYIHGMSRGDRKSTRQKSSHVAITYIHNRSLHYSLPIYEALNLVDGRSLDNVVYAQVDVVNPVLDKFETYADNGVNRSVYMHRNGSGEVVNGLPLYVYIHGMSRGGTNPSVDQKAAMKSANGAVALMQRMAENPAKYASHVLNISYPGVSTPATDDVKAVIDDLVASGAVDSNRIYVAGFSWGGAYTNTLLNDYPGFFAAGAPMSPVFGSPDAANNDAHADLAYWIFVNTHDGSGYQDNFNTFVENNLPEMTNARGSLFDSNRSYVWPYNQFAQPEQNPPLPEWLAHEVEAAVLYNNIYEDGWDMAPVAGELDERYTNLFDWMFAQSLEDEMIPEDPEDPVEEPVDPEVIAELEEQIRDLTERLEELEDVLAEEREELEQAIADLRAEIASLQAGEEELLDLIADLLARIDALEDRVTELEEAEDPEDSEDPADPEDPEDPEDPADPTDPEDPEDPAGEDADGEDSETPVEGTLPKTATNNFNMMLIGLALVLAGGISALIIRLKRQKSS